MQIKHLYGRKVMVDANALIYFLTGACNDLTVELFRAGALGKTHLVTTTRIMDEVLFKILLITAGELYGWKSRILERLKKDPEKIKRLAGTCQRVIELSETLNINIVEITKNTLFALPETISLYGLMGNDALTLKVMKERNMRYILTADRDFKGIEGIAVLDPVAS